MSLVLDFIFPKNCYGCRRDGFYLCPQCASRLPVNSVYYSKSEGPLESCLSLFPYRGCLKRLITDLKYSLVSDLASDLSAAAANQLKLNFPHLLDYWQKNHYLMVPIPLHPRRQNWRGFNQAELLARQLAALLSLEYTSDLLCRWRQTSSQALTKPSLARTVNVAGSFALNLPPGQLLPANIILVDDVATTRSTLSAAAALFSHPQASVWGLTLAGGH